MITGLFLILLYHIFRKYQTIHKQTRLNCWLNNITIIIFLTTLAAEASPRPTKKPGVAYAAPVFLFMILTAGLDGFGAIELFQHHDSCQMVGEGHFAHGEFEICHGF